MHGKMSRKELASGGRHAAAGDGALALSACALALKASSHHFFSQA
jgi:hypothetical protein